MLQPFVDELDPQRTIIRFDMPGLHRSCNMAARRSLLACLNAD
jgi:hypothetical protein